MLDIKITVKAQRTGSRDNGCTGRIRGKFGDVVNSPQAGQLARRNMATERAAERDACLCDQDSNRRRPRMSPSIKILKFCNHFKFQKLYIDSYLGLPKKRGESCQYRIFPNNVFGIQSLALPNSAHDPKA